MIKNFAQTRVSIVFSCTILEFQNTSPSECISPSEVVHAWFHEKTQWSKTLHKVEFQSIFRAPSRNFKILALPNVLAHGKS
ncbi:hypothetical protein BHM03_00021558 [Ensete ventricosum]|nr:hypothetical protein BHM03_00021558 [Ensete ventricosum]